METKVITIRWFRARLAPITLTVLLVICNPPDARSQAPSDLEAMTTRFNDLYGRGKYADATAVAQAALTLAERRLGKEHPETLLATSNLALAHQATGRYESACTSAHCKQESASLVASIQPPSPALPI